MKNYLLIAGTALALLAGAAAPSYAQSTPPGPNGGSFRHDAVPPPAAERMQAHNEAPAMSRHRRRHHRHYHHRHHHRHMAQAAGHVDRCKAHYRSYNAATDTFLGYDGKRHKCRL